MNKKRYKTVKIISGLLLSAVIITFIICISFHFYLPSWAIVSLIIGGLVAFFIIISGVITRCPSCNEWWGKTHIDTVEIDRWSGYGTVKRKKIIRDSRGKIIATEEWEETVPGIYIKYREYYKCKHCGYEWTEYFTRFKEY